MSIDLGGIAKRSYKVFIPGELVNLCIPSDEAIHLDGWADWFNNLGRLGSTNYGVFPNFPESQLAVLAGIKNRDKVALLICDKVCNRAFGVISLQSINFSAGSAEVAINVGAPERVPMPSFASLEAMALITQHGFEVMGLDRIYAGQAYPNLLGWNKLLELIAFRVEGITRDSFRRGHNLADTVLTACKYDDYVILKNKRGGLWGSLKAMKVLVRNQPKESFAQKFDKKIRELQDEHFKFLF